MSSLLLTKIECFSHGVRKIVGPLFWYIGTENPVLDREPYVTSALGPPMGPITPLPLRQQKFPRDPYYFTSSTTNSNDSDSNDSDSNALPHQ